MVPQHGQNAIDRYIDYKKLKIPIYSLIKLPGPSGYKQGALESDIFVANK
jgi:hypothetical protein